MACSVRETITRELRNNNFIDDKNNIIGDTSSVFPYIDSVNQFAKDNFGVTEDVLTTQQINNTAGAFVKVQFNNDVVEQIDTNRENNTFNSRYNDLPTIGDSIPFIMPNGDNISLEVIGETNDMYTVKFPDGTIEEMDPMILGYDSWETSKGLKTEQNDSSQIDYQLKVTNIITKNINKINQWYKQLKNTDQFWNKIQKDLQIPKEQLELFRNSDGDTIEKKLIDFTSNYSQIIKIDVAKQQYKEPTFNSEENQYDFDTEENKYSSGTENARYYSNLTVPGGTNYTENEISTPLITPSIKGHAQFSTDNGIGWFRGDEKVNNPNLVRAAEIWQEYTDRNASEEEMAEVNEMYNEEKAKGIPTKTRRILEVQSDLFQKGRDRKDLVQKDVKGLLASEPEGNTGVGTENPVKYQVVKRGNKYSAEAFYEYPDAPSDLAYSIDQGDDFNSYKEFDTKEEADKYLIELKDKINEIQGITKNSNENKFLQLLNKDNNWVTFFVKSIIQDSAKKGYEKVLFPSGDTASKIEGHSTLEEFKRGKESRIKILEQAIETNLKDTRAILEYNSNTYGMPAEVTEKDVNEAAEKSLRSYNTELTQLRQELENINGPEGFAALKPIYNFYENTVTNILKKQGYNPKLITDEHGSTWNEVKIEDKYTDTIFNSRIDDNEMWDPETDSILWEESDNSLFGSEEVNIPLGDNYGEFVKYKTQQYENIDNEIRSINSKLSSTTNKKPLIARRKTLQKDLKVLTEQLDQLKENKVQYMFQAIQQDLDNIEAALKGDSTINEVKDVESKLEFYDAFLWGKENEFTAGSLSEYVELESEFNSLVTQAKDLSNRYPEFLVKKIRQMLEDDPLIQETIDNTGFNLDALLSSERDITAFDSQLMGVMSNAFSKDNVLPQYIQILMHRTQIRHANTANELVARLNEVETKTGLYNPEWIFSKDENGHRDGFIIDLYTDDWFKSLGNYRKLKSVYTSNRNRETHKAVLDWIRNNTTIVDFTKIPEVRRLYASHSSYSKYFSPMSEEESQAWEQTMIAKYGPKYDSLVQNILQKLESFEQHSLDADKTDTYINSFNIWEYVNNLKAGKKDAHFIPVDDKNTAYFSDFDAIPFLPLDSVKNNPDIFGDVVPDTVYINQDFRDNIIGNPNNLEYYNAIKDLSQYVNDTYHTNLTGKLSYPRIRKTWLESSYETLKDIKNNKLKGVGDLAASTLHHWKGLAYERGSYAQENSDVHTNYTDSYNAEVREAARLNMIKGMSEAEAFKKAKTDLIEDYSQDLSRDLKAVSQMAALHNAREEVGPVAKATLNMYKGLTDANGKERKNAIKKLEYYVDHIIFNNVTKYRDSGKFEGKSWNPAMKGFLSVLDGVTGGKINTKSANYLSEGEQKLYEGFKEVLETGVIPESITINDIGFRLSKRQIEDVEGNKFTVFEDSGEKITEEDFNTKFKQYLEAKIESLGLDINLAGAIDGGLKTIILKSLALAPIPGIFNRIEGMNSGYIMDATGKYWKTGNMEIAKNMMAYWNTRRLPIKMLKNVGSEDKARQMRIFEELTKRMPGVLQDRKDELQRNSNDNKFSLEDMDVFIAAVGNPERKNQGGIMLSMMMDFMIEDSSGNKVPLLDKKTGRFNGFEIDNNGILRTKPGFEALEDIMNFEELIINMSVAISRSQGNYSANDIMLGKRTVWGRAATMFLTWLPEHINQRFGSSEQVDLYSRNKTPQGRYIAALKANKLNTLSLYGLGGLGISYGVLGMVGLVGGGIISAIVFRKYLAKYMNATPEGVKRDVNHIQEFLQMLMSLGIEFLNYPSYLLSSIPGMSKLKIKNRTFENTTMTEEQRNSMVAMTREVAIMLSWLSIKMAVMALYHGIGGEDDDEKSPRRMRYYFLQNQLSRSITTLSGFMNPYALAKDQSRNAFLSHLTDIFKLVHSVSTFDWQGIKDNSTVATPIPLSIDRTVRNLLGNRENSIIQDKIDYTSQVDFNKIPAPLRWTTVLTKDLFTDGEYSDKKEYNEAREKIREEIKKEVIEKYGEDKEVVEKITNTRMEQLVGSKYKDLSYAEATKMVEQGIRIQDPKKKASQTDRIAYKDKLKEEGLTDDEIAEIMREEFRGR